MEVSVIIPSYNERGVLEKCIESLGGQTLPGFEIIVVDDGSTDGTLEILKNLKKSLSNFRFLKQAHTGAGAARNAGARISKGKILVFVDADMLFDSHFLERLVGPIEKGESMGTFSKEESVANWNNVWARCWNLNEGWEPRRRHPKGYPDHQPVFRAILKSEFDKVGGFTPGGYNDDWSLSQKLGYEATNAPGAIIYHRNPGSLKEIFWQAKWAAKRKYKLGLLGLFLALLRVSLPCSLVVGITKGLRFGTPSFVIFKIVYDFGSFLGVLQYSITKRGWK
jgi:glycosyltransferase involved in cell wall biosynthesis